jgi:hypothetical protein
MKFKKATKNKFVFEQCDELGEVIPSNEADIAGLYISKSAFDKPLQFVTVTVEPGMQVNTDA